MVWCLPMRVLVEQTKAELERALSAMNLLWDGVGDPEGRVGVHVLMGGVESTDWPLHPEQFAVLIGTQDMLLSRALNRGYAAARARWPMEFGLLSQDCLWVMDEVQLMDVGLATSAQLQAFRDDDARTLGAPRPSATWWMSATLQQDWLRKSPDTGALVHNNQVVEIPATGRTGRLWDDVSKPLRLVDCKDVRAMASLALTAHTEGGGDGLTLVVVNTVKRAVALYVELKKSKQKDTDLRLVHSRFRPNERVTWLTDFLNKAACENAPNRIIVTTQVIEAGVDISANQLITELAPWTSLVQRFGRCARWGGRAEVTVVDLGLREKAALPYESDQLDAAVLALQQLTDVSPLFLEAFEADYADKAALYPYAPKHLLLRYELDELFDTAPDLSGADIDISRFIRSGDERDLQVFWAYIPADAEPGVALKPTRAALCPVPIVDAKKWLLENNKLKPKTRAWVWDYLDAQWQPLRADAVYPGQVILVASDTGGYDLTSGFDPNSHQVVPEVSVTASSSGRLLDADDHENSEALSETPVYQTIATHGGQVARIAMDIAHSLTLDHADLLGCVGRWHDVGKVHSAFSNSIKPDIEGRPQRQDLAKAPKNAWLHVSQMYRDSDGVQRAGFRHELASTLALFDVLQRHQPMHPALLGDQAELLAIAGFSIEKDGRVSLPPNVVEREILAMSADEFDLVAYLTCCHHGKVRVSWHSSSFDQEASDSILRIRGVRDHELLPALLLLDASGEATMLPESQLNLSASAIGLNACTGRSWTDRVLGLLRKYGPFTLAYFEAIIRAADQRASKAPIPDPLIATGHGEGA